VAYIATQVATSGAPAPIDPILRGTCTQHLRQSSPQSHCFDTFRFILLRICSLRCTLFLCSFLYFFLSCDSTAVQVNVHARLKEESASVLPKPSKNRSNLHVWKNSNNGKPGTWLSGWAHRAERSWGPGAFFLRAYLTFVIHRKVGGSVREEPRSGGRIWREKGGLMNINYQYTVVKWFLTRSRGKIGWKHILVSHLYSKITNRRRRWRKHLSYE